VKQKIKQANSTEIAERYLKKKNNPKSLNGEQIWALFKGDGTGDEIAIDFIKNFALQKGITLDLNEFDRIFLEQNEKALKNMKNTRKENTNFIELSNIFTDIPKTDNSYKYAFKINSEKLEADFISSKQVLFFYQSHINKILYLDYISFFLGKLNICESRFLFPSLFRHFHKKCFYA